MGSKGTRKGQASAIPLGSFHLLDSGPLQLSDPADEERAIVQEALHRGADLGEVWKLLFFRHHTDSPSWSLASSTGPAIENSPLFLPVDSALATEAQFHMVQAEIENYRRLIRSEFVNLPEIVQKAFASKEKNESQEEWLSRCFERYLKMRAAYYVAGYDTPAQSFLNKVQPAQCIEGAVDHGLHEDFKKRLAGLGKKLDGMRPGLAREVNAELSTIGFQPRFIAPKQGHSGPPSLSNHAFGLAIDINATWNPHIKDQEVIQTIKEAIGYDFGALFAPMCAPDLVLVEESYRKALEASVALQSWLKHYLPIFVGIVTQEKSPSKKGKKTKDPLADLVGASIDPTCRELDLETETNIIRLMTIHKYHTIHELQRWADRGVVSLPLSLVIAMKDLRFGWGGEWESSKDFMHFELNHKNIVPPENPPRPLDELFPQNPGSHCLLAAAVRQRRAKRSKH